MNESLLNKVDKARERLESMSNEEFKKLLDKNSVKADSEYDCDFTWVAECEYCRIENPKTIHENHEFDITFNFYEKELDICFYSGGFYGGQYSTQFKVNYCPMCGRDLRE